MNTEKLNFDKSGGLLPVVAQDAETNIVLMQGWINREALAKTMESGKLTFFSRSKNRLWTKGESSGNFLLVKDILADCDNDCLLAKVEPAGPACHTGQDTCFGEDNTLAGRKAADKEDEHGGLAFLDELESILRSRQSADPSISYTARLFASGPGRIAKKVGEEAVELILEAESGDRQRFVEEAADLLYHMDVLLIHRGMGWKDVVDELRVRHSGS